MLFLVISPQTSEMQRRTKIVPGDCLPLCRCFSQSRMSVGTTSKSCFVPSWLCLWKHQCFCLHCVTFVHVVLAGTPLSDYILHYEPLHYDADTFHTAHHRSKRSTRHDLHLDFHAHGKWVQIPGPHRGDWRRLCATTFGLWLKRGKDASGTDVSLAYTNLVFAPVLAASLRDGFERQGYIHDRSPTNASSIQKSFSLNLRGNFWTISNVNFPRANFVFKKAVWGMTRKSWATNVRGCLQFLSRRGKCFLIS